MVPISTTMEVRNAIYFAPASGRAYIYRSLACRFTERVLIRIPFQQIY